MKPEHFIRWAEGYYGAQYNPVCKAELATWLSDKEPHFIAGLRERVREEYSNQYRLPPDIAVLERIHRVTPQHTYDRGRQAIAAAEIRAGLRHPERTQIEERATPEQVAAINKAIHGVFDKKCIKENAGRDDDTEEVQLAQF